MSIIMILILQIREAVFTDSKKKLFEFLDSNWEES